MRLCPRPQSLYFFPAPNAADKTPSHEFLATASPYPLCHVGKVCPPPLARRSPKGMEHVLNILPGPRLHAHDGTVAAVGVAIQLGQSSDEPNPERIQVDVADQL